MTVAKYEPVIREEYLRPRISVKKVIFLFAIARLVKAGSIVSTVYISICLKKKNFHKKL